MTNPLHAPLVIMDQSMNMSMSQGLFGVVRQSSVQYMNMHVDPISELTSASPIHPAACPCNARRTGWRACAGPSALRPGSMAPGRWNILCTGKSAAHKLARGPSWTETESWTEPGLQFPNHPSSSMEVVCTKCSRQLLSLQQRSSVYFNHIRV